MTTNAEELELVKLEDFSYFISREVTAALPMYRLTATQYDVWHTMLSAMERGGLVLLTLDDIAERLGTYKTNVSPALTVLRERGLLWREQNGVYRINPRIAFRGTVEEWNEALAEMPADAPEVVIPAYRRRPPRVAKNRQQAKLSSVK